MENNFSQPSVPESLLLKLVVSKGSAELLEGRMGAHTNRIMPMTHMEFAD